MISEAYPQFQSAVSGSFDNNINNTLVDDIILALINDFKSEATRVPTCLTIPRPIIMIFQMVGFLSSGICLDFLIYYLTIYFLFQIHNLLPLPLPPRNDLPLPLR